MQIRWKPLVVRAALAFLTLAIGIIILNVIGKGISYSRAQADIIDCGVPADVMYFPLAFAITSFCASAIGRIFGLSVLWNVIAIPILLYFICTAHWCFLCQGVGISQMMLEDVIPIAFGKTRVYVYALSIGPALFSSLLATITVVNYQGSIQRKIIKSLGVVFCGWFIAELLILLIYSQTVCSIKMNNDLLMRSVEAYKRGLKDGREHRPIHKFGSSQPPPMGGYPSCPAMGPIRK